MILHRRLYLIHNNGSLENRIAEFKDNPLIKLHNEESRLLVEIKANRQPIEIHIIEKPFVTHEVQLLQGDAIYMFSDGFVDQFGGEKGGKYKSKKFRNLLLSIQNKPMLEQKNILNSTFEN